MMETSRCYFNYKCLLGRRNFYEETKNIPEWFPQEVKFRRPNHPKCEYFEMFPGQTIMNENYIECIPQKLQG